MATKPKSKTHFSHYRMLLDHEIIADGDVWCYKIQDPAIEVAPCTNSVGKRVDRAKVRWPYVVFFRSVYNGR